MGTRLYPRTNNVVAIERIIGVPAGTHDRLLAVKTRHEAELEGVSSHPAERQEIEYRQWCEINNDPEIGKLDAFLTFGWGKFRGGDIAPDYAGSLADLSKVAKLFAMNGIDADPELCEGVCWS